MSHCYRVGLAFALILGAARAEGQATAADAAVVVRAARLLDVKAGRYVDNPVVVVANLDPFATQEGVCLLPVATGLPPTYRVRDLLAENDWTWHIGRNYVRLDPGQAHVLRVGG